ncbi:M20/M25/M40 family metallo-hydrolase [Chondrinema litorale]|uniref:M20/M25/M40 family metallo-hydrolase n=1 Tax=Chondrinema litorale TaxID=2994555 RepID=UPI0025430960|nr:M20/M25/M40 family metallo-hydrolase [Chondrinema litorale]UZR93585.1 M20/M25/M40 family metallo-hydrolase [Chondrinema litorale]
MKTILLFGLLWLYITTSINAQEIINRDAEIAKMVSEISAENIEANVRKLVTFGTRHTLSDTKSKDKGVGAARIWVKSQFDLYAEESGGRFTAEIDEYTIEADGRRIPEEALSANVVGVLKGTNPDDDRVFLITGHLDSRATDVMDTEIDAPGANDDGSGVAVVMELARIMSKREFPSTIIFMAVTGEEQGLYGAGYMADKLLADSTNLVAVVNNDMVGNSTSSGTNLLDNTQVRVFSEGVPAFETEEMERMRRYTSAENDSKSRQLARYIKEVGERYVDQLEVKLVYRNDRFLRGGDHTPFARKGFTAVRMCEMNENYYHQHQTVRKEDGIQYGDLPEFMDFEYARKNAGVNLATLANLAWAPASPENVGVDVSGLSNSTRLVWDDPQIGKKPKGYYVLMRETYQPLWEKKFYVEGNEAVIPYSKDNYFFAVQAVDEEGHESLAIFPVPKR